MTRQSPLVLLAASGSEASRRATVVAADLASTFDAQLTILHVTPPLEYRVGGSRRPSRSPGGWTTP